MTLDVFRAIGADLRHYLDDLAALRISVFREPPYRYDGDLAYETSYLASYAASPDSLVVIARDGERVVGASTALPLLAHGDDVVPPLVRAGYDPARVYYFGESVLEPAYRGRGLGTRFFVEREARARELGYATAAFCAVERPGHQGDYALWKRAGFTRRPEIVGEMSSRDVGATEETAKAMVFWTKELA